MNRILIFSLAYYPHVGGAEVAIKEITDRMRDIEFDMITLRFGQEPKVEQVGRVVVHRVGFGGGYVSKMLFVALAALKAHHLHKKSPYQGAWAMMSYMLLPLRLSLLHVPYVLTLQEGDTEEHMFGRAHIAPFMPLIEAGFREARVVQVISTYLGEWARRRGFTGPLEVIPNGVDIKRFAGDGIMHEGVTLITASRLVHKNGIDTVIRALPLIPVVRFVIYGSGPQEAAYKKLAKELNVSNRVVFKGYVEHNELPHALHAADIFIRPSRSEGMGNSFLEAFAAGLPVIATQEGGIADFLYDAKKNPDKPTTGWAIEKDNPQEIAQAVGEILGNPEATKKVIETAKQLAEKKYDWDLIAKDMRTKVFAKLV